MNCIGKVSDYKKDSQTYIITYKNEQYLAFKGDMLDEEIRIHDIVMFKNSVFKHNNRLYKKATLINRLY